MSAHTPHTIAHYTHYLTSHSYHSLVVTDSNRRTTHDCALRVHTPRLNPTVMSDEAPSTLNPQPSTLDPTVMSDEAPSTLNPKP